MLVLLGAGFGFVSFGALGNILGWLAILTTLGFMIVPSYALFERVRIKQLPTWARMFFMVSVISALCFIILMALLVLALRNNFS